MSLIKRAGRTAKALLADHWSVLLLVAAWQAWVEVMHLNVLVMPHPLDVARDIAAASSQYVIAAAWTTAIAASGLFLAMCIGTLLAVAAWSARVAAPVVTGASLIINCVPVVAFIPILGRAAGYGWRTDLLIVTLFCFFPFFSLVGSGLRAQPPGTADLLSVLGASGWIRLRYLALPAALQQGAVALRVATPGAVLGALSAEYLMGTPGLGAMASDSMAQFDTVRAMGASLVAAALALTGYALVGLVQRRIRHVLE